MSAHAQPHDPNTPEVYFQFEDIDQQQETYIIGMWTFLAQEIMFFGGLFLMYVIYRWKYQPDWYLYHEQLDFRLGAVNTTVLLLSSFLAALAVHFSQKKNKKMELSMLAGVIICAFCFLGVKTVEYGQKAEHHLYPNHTFQYGVAPQETLAVSLNSGREPAAKVEGATEKEGFFTQLEGKVDTVWPKEHHQEEGNPDKARLFFSLYFIMTGLHGLHVIVGILLFSVLMWLIATKSALITDYIPTEMLCLYWHFVDLVWIFLYPLFYLIPK